MKIFLAVREAAVYSLGKLAVNRPTFANATIDHLADMFNDEIAQVYNQLFSQKCHFFHQKLSKMAIFATKNAIFGAKNAIFY